ncbi:5-oxoprolinase subunit PxpB [Winogradskyella sp. PG-2]|uniref:5-oxoprolinase subunit PxpB n=1 Tax=Winogradskyella sp. PG-2 TaxID=754409 RepID=UPI000458983C|nr:5-oxoprolinase subunit PxpB [Winogradskyella sp. PG-2]BAO77641.1 allophanate hydrolase 2 subunit 1 [Winogradskyella sp. PG-2]
MEFKLQYSQLNEYSILIEWPVIIDEKMLKNILNFKNAIHKKYSKQKVEVINTYNSILIIYDFNINDATSEFEMLKSLFLDKTNYSESKPHIWEVPVCYDDEFGVDLEHFSNLKKLSISEIIQLHSEAIYTVYFIGFLPGFLYLGGLNSNLFLDRKTAPKLNVKEGSVAIGGQQTGIYPQDSPGGWHIIGNSPIKLFNSNQNPPCNIKAGDKVKFVPISNTGYKHIQLDIMQSEYQLKSIKIDA